jgi:hypothetical protein
MFIRSERLFLRPAWAEDLSALEAEFAAGLPCVAMSRSDSRYPQFLITRPHADGVERVGWIALKPGICGPQVQCRIAPRHCGKGYAAEAEKAVREVAAMLGHVVEPSLSPLGGGVSHGGPQLQMQAA